MKDKVLSILITRIVDQIFKKYSRLTTENFKEYEHEIESYLREIEEEMWNEYSDRVDGLVDVPHGVTLSRTNKGSWFVSLFFCCLLSACAVGKAGGGSIEAVGEGASQVVAGISSGIRSTVGGVGRAIREAAGGQESVVNEMPVSRPASYNYRAKRRAARW
jgi:hypothetical protein